MWGDDKKPSLGELIAGGSSVLITGPCVNCQLHTLREERERGRGWSDRREGRGGGEKERYKTRYSQ